MRNIGTYDRVIRLVVGIILLLVGLGGLFGSSMVAGIGTGWSWAALIVGAVMVVTALIRFCPAYTLFGWNTCKRD